MLDIKRIRERPDEVREGLKRRWMDTALVDNVLELDAKRRALVTETDALKAKRNEVSKSIGARVKAGEDVEAVKAEMRAVGDAIAAKDVEIRATEEAFREAMLRIPNVPNKDIATGPDSSANRDVRHVGTMPTFDFQPLDHIALGEKLGIFDFPRGVKLTGTGFPILLGPGARLQRALIQYMLDLHTRFQGYTEMLPPFVVNTASMIGTGQLPKMKDDMYHCEVDDFWLIPTAEVPVTNYYRDDVLEAAQLPVKLTAYTPCFRREAGSAGKDTRGILRVHQFDKVEMVKFVGPPLPRARALLRRHLLLRRQVLRPGALGPRPAGLARGLQLLQLRELPGPPRQHPLPPPRRQARLRAHPQRLRRGPPPPDDRHPRAMPAGRRLRPPARGHPPLLRRRPPDPREVTHAQAHRPP